MKFRYAWLICTILFASPSRGQEDAVYVQAHHLTYDVLYEYPRLAPAVVSYILDGSDFRGTQLSKPKHFKMDYRLPPPRVKNSAYTFSGYQRGHLCPSGDRDSRKDWYKDTYYTSNIVPMTAVANAGGWKETETFCRLMASKGHRLKIACGPVWYHWPGISNTCSSENSIAAGKFTAVGNTIGVAAVPPAMWKVAKCLLHDAEVYSWVVNNDNNYRPESACRVLPDSVGRLLAPKVKEYVSVWMRK